MMMFAGGCRPDERGPEVLSLEGKIERLEVNADGTGEISVLYYSDKKQADIIGTAQVTKETEIMINGATATLADLRDGDVVRGDVRVEGKGSEKKQVALKIHVERAVPVGG